MSGYMYFDIVLSSPKVLLPGPLVANQAPSPLGLVDKAPNFYRHLLAIRRSWVRIPQGAELTF